MSASFLGHTKSFTPAPNLFNNLKKINPAKRTFFQEDKINKTEDYVRTNKLISQNCGSKHIIKPNSVSRERTNISSEVPSKGYTTSPVRKTETSTSGRKNNKTQKLMSIVKDKLHSFNDKSLIFLKKSISPEKNEQFFEAAKNKKLYETIKNSLKFSKNLKNSESKKKLGQKTKNESSEKKLKNNNIGNITSNLINININNLIKEPGAKNLCHSTENIKKRDKNEYIELYLLRIEKKLISFYEKYGLQENENVSVMKFIQHFFELLDEMTKNKEETYSNHFKNIFKSLKDIIELPFARIIEQFAKMREIYLQKLAQLKEFDNLKLENEMLVEKIKFLVKEIEKSNPQKFKIPEPIKSRSFANLEDIQLENEKLRQIVQKQRQTLSSHLIKDEKIMKLLNAIRKKGINIEQIYHENVQSSDESGIITEQVELEKESAFDETDNDTANFNLNSASTEQKNSQRKNFNLHFNLKEINNDKNEENKKNNRLTFSFNQENSFENSKSPQMKQKLKLNLGFLKEDPSKNKKELGFHEEFMARMNEFSESWRQAAMKEKKF